MPKEEIKTTGQAVKSKSVQYVTVGQHQSGRRIDNFLLLQLKGVPKTRIYQMLRKGEVRLNGSRIKQSQRLEEGDVVRIPPVRMRSNDDVSKPSRSLVDLIENACFYEDAHLLVINKPSGVVVHSGSGQQHGVIESLRQSRPDASFLELAHRLDRDTSGCLLLAKDPDTLRDIQKAMKSGETKKNYLAFIRGRLEKKVVLVDQALQKGTLAGGERIVRIDDRGKKAQTRFRQKSCFQCGSLVSAELITGRTHQIRAHGSYLGNPLAMDHKYGDRDFNKSIKKQGLKRLFLHASELEIHLSHQKKPFHFEIPLPSELSDFLAKIK